MKEEIKLILCDMDGTLLNSRKELPSTFETVFETLEKQGIILGIASGRPLSCMRERFPKLHSRMAIIAENGGCVYYKGKVIHLESIPKECCNKVVEKVRSLRDCSLVLCAMEHTYIEDTYESLVKVCQEYYPNLEIVEDLKQVEDSILKMSIRDYDHTAVNTVPAFKDFDERMDYAASGEHWLDVMNLGASKGKGVKILCDYLQLECTQVMAFGDHFNDYEMLKEVKYSYAMGNAIDEIKEICAYTCDSCDEDGVMKTLKQVFGI